MTARLHVLVGAATIDDVDQRRLVERFPEVRFTLAERATDAEMTAAVAECGAIFTKGASADVVAAARTLRWLQAGTAGVDRVLRLLEGRDDVIVTNARGAHGIPMAENILTMMLCFATRMHRLIRTQPHRARIGREVIAEKWELHGQTMLVLGLGDIGGTLAEKAKALGMRVLGVRRSGEPSARLRRAAPPDGSPPRGLAVPHHACEVTYTPDQLHEVLPLADHVAVCLPLTGETRAIIGETELRLMKRTAHIYNVGRGAAIEGKAMRCALTEGWIAGAGLDCVDPSDVPADDDVLWAMENVILSHHTSGSSPYNSQRITDIFAENLWCYLAGQPLTNVVSRERGY